jgi:putative ABC transport system ATP-binding protein
MISATHEPLVELRGVTVSYGRGESRIDALRDVDLAVSAGEVLALRGRSGSGKTTVLHVMGGLVAPTTGGVEWAGRPFGTLDARARAGIRAHGIAYVFQGANLLPTLTAYENVAFAARLSDAPPAFSPLELLQTVGLGDKADSLPGDLSGGEAQRVALARATAQQPRALLCDEPTGHLDSDTGERVLDLIEALRQELEFTVVIATHDEAVATRADRTVELLDGRIVGTHAVL